MSDTAPDAFENPDALQNTVVWVDHDATPSMIVDILHRAAMRREVPTCFVANRVHQHPNHPSIRSVVVSAGPDEADNYIAEHCGKQQVVITSDIPLAARAVEAGSTVIDHRGRVLTEEEVREALSMRNFHQELRDAGVETGGPKAYKTADKQAFANALDRWLTRHHRRT